VSGKNRILDSLVVVSPDVSKTGLGSILREGGREGRVL